MMNDKDIQFLKDRTDKAPVKLFLSDGEEIVAKILWVSDYEKDVIFDILSTNRKDKKVDGSVTYLVNFDQITAVSESA